MLSIFKDLLEKKDSMQEQMWNFKREVGTFFFFLSSLEVKEISRQRKTLLNKDVICEPRAVSIYSLRCFCAHAMYVWFIVVSY